MNTKDRQQRIRELMPREYQYGIYSKDTVKNCKEIIRLVRNEPDKKLQFAYFGALADKLFLKSPGFFVGTMTERHLDMLKSQSKEICSMLRMMKKLHFDINYTPACIMTINALIRHYGGTVQTKAELSAQKQEKLRKAKEKLEAKEKLPRKKKKMLISLFGREIQM